MGRYTADPTKVTTSIAIFAKGDVELKAGRPKAFERTNSKNEQSYGIRIPVTAVGGPEDGRRSIISLYMQSDGAQSMAKRLQMAIAGFAVNDKNEKLFDVEAAGLDWSFDTETGDVGDAWAKYEGCSFIASVDVEMSKPADGSAPREQQKWVSYMPITPR